MEKVFFVSGIDTDAGKSYATGVFAARMMAEGHRVVTQKFVQTGCGEPPYGVSEDIALHRKIMGTGLLPRDLDGTTCGQMFSYPASADLAARLEGRRVDLDAIGRNTAKLLAEYDIVFIEGAGGLMVPVDGAFTVADYIARENLPLVLVTNPRLGSVNHTLLSLEVCRSRGIRLAKVIYNQYPVTSDTITEDTCRFLTDYLRREFPGVGFEEVPFIADAENYDPRKDLYYRPGQTL